MNDKISEPRVFKSDPHPAAREARNAALKDDPNDQIGALSDAVDAALALRSPSPSAAVREALTEASKRLKKFACDQAADHAMHEVVEAYEYAAALILAVPQNTDPAGAGEPFAWMFELAGYITPEKEYTGWGKPQLSFTKPCVPDGSIRNLTPLYPPSPVIAAPDGLFTYTRTFNAIAAATEINAVGIGISVRKFIEAFGPINAAAPDGVDQPALDAEWNRAIEEAAKLIEANQIVDGSAGQSTSPRSEGNRAGLAYADAIRSLTRNSNKEGLPE